MVIMTRRSRVGLPQPAFSLFDAESLKTLVEAGELSATVDQPLLPAGPGRMRFRIDIEPQCISRLAVGRTRLVRAPVRHHDGNLVIIRVNSFLHRTILLRAGPFTEAAMSRQSMQNSADRQCSTIFRRGKPAWPERPGRTGRQDGRCSGRALPRGDLPPHKGFAPAFAAAA